MRVIGYKADFSVLDSRREGTIDPIRLNPVPLMRQHSAPSGDFAHVVRETRSQRDPPPGFIHTLRTTRQTLIWDTLSMVQGLATAPIHQISIIASGELPRTIFFAKTLGSRFSFRAGPTRPLNKYRVS